MTEQEHSPAAEDAEMSAILEKMLAGDEDITARAVARLHPSIKAASSITRSERRSKLLAQYQERQAEYRRWRNRAGKQSSASIAASFEQKEQRINELEANVQILIASHVAMLRAIGELGGFSKWAKFYEQYREVRDDLAKIGAMSEATIYERPKKKS
ncbi:MAG TPA: hypothetical protein VF472_14760 [Burkholderiaceae bacterium]